MPEALSGRTGPRQTKYKAQPFPNQSYVRSYLLHSERFLKGHKYARRGQLGFRNWHTSVSLLSTDTNAKRRALKRSATRASTLLADLLILSRWTSLPVKIQRLWKLFRPHPNSTMLAWASRHPASSWIMIGTRSIFYHLSDAEYLVNIQSTEQWYGTEGMEFSNTRLLGIVLHAVIRDYSVCWSTIICSRSIPADPSQLEEACVGVYREIRSPGVPRGTAVQVEPTSE